MFELRKKNYRALYESGLYTEPAAAEEGEEAPTSNLDAVSLPGCTIPSASDLVSDHYPHHSAELPNVLRLCYLAQKGSGADVLNFVEWAKANGDRLPSEE